MRDEEAAFLAESALRDYDARMWERLIKYNKRVNGLEHSLCAIKGIRSKFQGGDYRWIRRGGRKYHSLYYGYNS